MCKTQPAATETHRALERRSSWPWCFGGGRSCWGRKVWSRDVIKCVSEWQLLSHVWLFATPWTVTCQAPLSMEFSRQEYQSGLPFPTPIKCMCMSQIRVQFRQRTKYMWYKSRADVLGAEVSHGLVAPRRVLSDNWYWPHLWPSQHLLSCW